MCRQDRAGAGRRRTVEEPSGAAGIVGTDTRCDDPPSITASGERRGAVGVIWVRRLPGFTKVGPVPHRLAYLQESVRNEEVSQDMKSPHVANLNGTARG